jgi:hypothetical protein
VAKVRSRNDRLPLFLNGEAAGSEGWDETHSTKTDGVSGTSHIDVGRRNIGAEKGGVPGAWLGIYKRVVS